MHSAPRSKSFPHGNLAARAPVAVQISRPAAEEGFEAATYRSTGAFGCVLYQMLSGRVAFAGETVSDTIARVLEREPDWSVVPADTPASIRRLLMRCLTKEPQQRLRDIGEVRIEVGAIGRTLRDQVAVAEVPPALPHIRHGCRGLWPAHARPVSRSFSCYGRRGRAVPHLLPSS